MRKTSFCFVLAAGFVLLCCRCSLALDDALDLTALQAGASGAVEQRDVVTVTLRGKINHSGSVDYHAVVPGVSVWVAEFPESRGMGVRSDASGWWTMRIRKRKGGDVGVSLIYEKPGWITTKSNVITVRDADDTDIAIQYIDPFFFRIIIRPLIQMMMRDMLPKGADATLRNAVVATVGKSWASIHDDRLPHGDPGATVNAVPGAIGPLYFDENVRPNPAYLKTSVDGGVAWLNAPAGDYTMNAVKQGVSYSGVRFVVAPSDAAAGVVLYIASPPDSIQGSNDSAPGEF